MTLQQFRVGLVRGLVANYTSRKRQAYLKGGSYVQRRRIDIQIRPKRHGVPDTSGAGSKLGLVWRVSLSLIHISEPTRPY